MQLGQLTPLTQTALSKIRTHQVFCERMFMVDGLAKMILCLSCFSIGSSGHGIGHTYSATRICVGTVMVVVTVMAMVVMIVNRTSSGDVNGHGNDNGMVSKSLTKYSGTIAHTHHKQ
jgi:hypothetical protein